MKKIVIYGSYGYTGKLISEIAAGSEIPVLLSGRNEQELRMQSNELNLSFKKASLDSDSEMDALLEDATVVIHCAGPFINTWNAMARACLRNRCHYLDITGEIPVFESLKAIGEKFREQDLLTMPGVGFDVVPTDCMASYLHGRMPDATALELAFMGIGGAVSRGTARTMVENLGSGGVVRRGGELKIVPAGFKTKEIDFTVKKRSTVSIPWGDISTAYTSTGIKDITVYMAAPKSVIRGLKWSNYLKLFLKSETVKNLFRKKIDQRPEGPDEVQRKTGTSNIWGRVENEKGENIEAAFQTAEGYRLTAEMSWHIAKKVVHGEMKPGYHTPSSLFGWKLIFEHPDTKWIKKADQ